MTFHENMYLKCEFLIEDLLLSLIFSWPATCVIGLPKVYPRHGDIPGAWAPEVKDDKQFLEVHLI